MGPPHRMGRRRRAEAERCRHRRLHPERRARLRHRAWLWARARHLQRHGRRAARRSVRRAVGHRGCRLCDHRYAHCKASCNHIPKHRCGLSSQPYRRHGQTRCERFRAAGRPCRRHLRRDRRGVYDRPHHRAGGQRGPAGRADHRARGRGLCQRCAHGAVGILDAGRHAADAVCAGLPAEHCDHRDLAHPHDVGGPVDAAVRRAALGPVGRPAAGHGANERGGCAGVSAGWYVR